MSLIDATKVRRRGQNTPIIGGPLACALAVLLCLLAMAGCSADGSDAVAARFDGDGVITEQQVSAYLASYRKQQGFEASSDEAWEDNLESIGMNSEELREQIIEQLVIDEMVKRRAAELGVEVDEEALQEYIEEFKGNLAFGDDEVYRQTLEMQGQTVEEAEEGFRNLFLQRALFEKEVPKPELENGQVVTGLANAYPNGIEMKHVYRFVLDGFDEEGSYEKFAAVQDAREWFAGEGRKPDADRFAELVADRSDDQDVLASAGDDGWSVTAYEHSQEYQEILEGLDAGAVSDVFVDDAGYAFVWVDRSYSLLPASKEGYSIAQLDDIPSDLLAEIKQDIAEQYWQLDCQRYLQELSKEAQVQK